MPTIFKTPAELKGSVGQRLGNGHVFTLFDASADGDDRFGVQQAVLVFVGREVHPSHSAGQQFRRGGQVFDFAFAAGLSGGGLGRSWANRRHLRAMDRRLDRRQDIAPDSGAGLEQVARVRLDVQHGAVGRQTCIGADGDKGH